MKELYRKKYLKIRKMINGRELKDNTIYHKIINNEMVIRASLILIYVSLKDEVDTTRIIEYLLSIGKKVAVPKIERDMGFFYIDNLRELKKGKFGVLEPISNNLVKGFNNVISITPGICYDKNGFRIGYGRGYYDKFYQKHPDIYKIGLCYRELILDNIPHNEFDIQVNEIISN